MIILKTSLSFFILLILAKILGKKQMSQMTFFNYMTGITMGSLAANIISTGDNSIYEEMLGLTWWCGLTAFLGYITLKSGKLRLLIDGQPVILIRKGSFEKESMKKTKMSIEDTLIMLREQNIFSVSEVDYAILEPNGKLSILKKQDYLNPTNLDMKISTLPPKHLPRGIILNSNIVYENLEELGITMDWLKKEMNNQNIKNVEEIFYGEIKSDGSLYIIKH